MVLTRSLCSGLMGAMLLLGTPLSAQRRTDLPPPDSSRAPLLTRAPADSIRYQTAYLHAAELLQALQAGDATTIGALLENTTLASATCGSVGEAFSRIATRVRRIARSDGGTSMALFFDKITIVDSGTTQVVTAELVLMPATSGVPVRSSVRLVLDPGRAAWTREAGLLEAFCGL
jgi:hypothetical protein